MPYPVAAARGRAPLSSAFSPLSLSPVAWYDLSDLSTLFQDAARTTPAVNDGDPVGGVTDKSGSGNHLAQATSSKRPMLKLAIQNGRAVLRFDGVDDFLALAGLVSGASVYSIFTVSKGSAGVLLHNGSNRGVLTRQASGDGSREISHRGVADLADAANPVGWEVRSAVRTSAPLVSYRANGTSQSLTDASSGMTVSAGGFSLGCRDSANTPAEFLAADLGEAFYFAASLSDVQVAQMETYCNSHWGLF